MGDVVVIIDDRETRTILRDFDMEIEYVECDDGIIIADYILAKR